MDSGRFSEDFKNLSIAEIEYLFNETRKAFNKALNSNCYTNELYNDDGEYNLIKWLQEL
jgi:hypothetical protein